MDYLSAIQKLAVQLRKRNHRNEELTVGKHHWKIEKQPEWYVKAVRKTIAALPGGYAEAADWLDVTENALFNRLRADGDQIFPLGWAMVLQRAGGTHFIADAVAQSANGVFVSLPDVEDVDNADINQRLLEVIEQIGSYSKQIRSAIEDGVVEPHEKTAINDELYLSISKLQEHAALVYKIFCVSESNDARECAAPGVECLESWLLREKGCQWPHSDWHSENMTTMRHAPGAIRLCWHCDNQLRDQFTERLESMATDNCAHWVLSVVRRDLGFDDSHVVTMPELCWWLVRNDLADALPESAARKALRLPKPVVPSVTRESDLVPSVPATSIIQDKAKKVLALKVDPESPESFMLRPKRRRWVNEKYTRWVKTQPCACCGKPADDPHHLIGHGQGGMGTKAHDLFVLPLCRKHHDELHADTVAFEEMYGSQLELIFRFIDHALAIGVLA